jgi:hypothetical protein
MDYVYDHEIPPLHQSSEQTFHIDPNGHLGLAPSKHHAFERAYI